MLPLESAAYGPAAEAVKAGFLAAAKRAGISSRIRVIGHGDDAVLPALAAAVDAGVALVVGPLTRDDLKTVLAMAPSRPRMLALNQTDDGLPLPDNVYALAALSVDNDAAQIARVARAGRRAFGGRRREQRRAAAPVRRGVRRRMAKFRTSSCEASIVSTRTRSGWDSSRRELAARASRRGTAGDRRARTSRWRSRLLPQVRVYAVSQIADDLPPTMLRDLEGVRYVEIPWLAGARQSGLGRRRRATRYESPLLERLYALGLDALALAQMFAEPAPPDRVELDGATGHLSLTPARTFARQGRLMVIRNGRAMPDRRPMSTG